MDKSELFYYNYDRVGRKCFFRYSDNKPVSVSSIKHPDRVKLEARSYHAEIEDLMEEISDNNKKIKLLRKFFSNYGIDTDEKYKYKEKYFANKAKAEKYDCYKKFLLNGVTEYYSYEDDSIIKKNSLKKINTLENDGIEPYKLIEDYKETKKKIKELKDKILDLQEKIKEIGKSPGQLNEEYQKKKEKIIQRKEEKKVIQEQKRAIEKANKERRRNTAWDSDSLANRMKVSLERDIKEFRNTNKQEEEIQIEKDLLIVDNKNPFDINVEDESTEIETIQCQICMDNKKKIVLNCGHTLCVACLKEIGIRNDHNCPICRLKITSTIILYL